jgi:hypothetical protein
LILEKREMALDPLAGVMGEGRGHVRGRHIYISIDLFPRRQHRTVCHKFLSYSCGRDHMTEGATRQRTKTEFIYPINAACMQGPMQ